MPHALTEQQKWRRSETCRIHLESYQNEGKNLLNNIITIDETWVRAYEPGLKRHSAEWNQRITAKTEISSESISCKVNGNFGR